MFFMTNKSKTLDAYDQIKEIVYTLLLHECPEHRTQYHILYSANVRLTHMEQAKQHFRALIDPATPTGTYARIAYETTVKKYNELSLLIRGYMYLCDETERDLYNHNFLFSKEKIGDCYTLLTERKTYEDILPIEEDFWQALRAQTLPILGQIT